MRKGLSLLSKFGRMIVWAANFAGQTWTETIDTTGGYGGWSAGSGYMPRRNSGGNGIIQWQSTTNWYYGYIIDHWIEPSTIQIIPTVLEGAIYGIMNTGLHTQTTSYNFFCSTAAYGADETSTYRWIRNSNGLSFSICSQGGYYGSNTVCKAYLNNVLLGTVGTIASCGTDYTLKFKLVGKKLYAYFGAGDSRGTEVSMTLISENADTSTLSGRNTIIYMSSWITNDQGESCYGQVNSISLKNYD